MFLNCVVPNGERRQQSQRLPRRVEAGRETEDCGHSETPSADSSCSFGLKNNLMVIPWLLTRGDH